MIGAVVFESANKENSTKARCQANVETRAETRNRCGQRNPVAARIAFRACGVGLRIFVRRTRWLQRQCASSSVKAAWFLEGWLDRADTLIGHFARRNIHLFADPLRPRVGPSHGCSALPHFDPDFGDRRNNPSADRRWRCSLLVWGFQLASRGLLVCSCVDECGTRKLR